MADSTQPYIYDVNSPTETGLLENFLSTTPGVVPDYVRFDRHLSFLLRPVVASQTRAQSNGRPWDDDALPGDTYIFAIGLADQPASGGTFKLTIDGINTGLTVLPYNVSAALLQTPLSAASVAGGHSALTVTNPSTGVYDVRATANGVLPAIVADPELLLPNCDIIVSVLAAGTISTKGHQIITIRQQNVAVAQPSTALPAAGVTRTYDQVGDATSNTIVRISFDAPNTYGGLYSINLTAGGYTAACGQAGPLYTIEELGAVLRNHPAIFYGSSGGEANNIAITKDGPDFLIEFIGTLAATFTWRNIWEITSVDDPAEVTTGNAANTAPGDNNFQTGQTVRIADSTGHTPDANGDYIITRTNATTFTIPQVFSGGSSPDDGHVFLPVFLTVANVSLLAPLGVTGYVDLNTYNMAAAFWQTSEPTITFQLSVQRTRASGEVRTSLLTTCTIHRNIIDTTSLVPVNFPDIVTAASLRQANTISVDPDFGSDTNGAREKPLTNPFLTVTAAMAAAVSGDTIFPRPGTYTFAAPTYLILKDGVNIDGLGQVTFQITEDSTAEVIRDSGSPVAAQISGIDILRAVNNQNGKGVEISNSASAVTFTDCDIRVTASGSGAPTAVIFGDGGNVLTNCRLDSTSTSACTCLFTGNNAKLNGTLLISEASTPCIKSGGAVSVQCAIPCASNTDVDSGVTAVGSLTVDPAFI